MKAKTISRELFIRTGRVGGKAKSKAKLAAIRANLEKARAKRWPKKKAAA